ncbi:Glycine/D-amino acid oxidase [Pseudomonas syringae pv. actinidiae]|uniref:Glycine/D-amino acid oxidase n=1 Tax=Pseudomonas syringae pv. actinidiae TaxID=103796 RepID=A0A2V0Q5U8_PSESF|nr:Glycine/D-amino acid oxidase [Pseudomonas syringae pv. actinidiae]GBH20118.1 Glycine/D-amino acid oxidase [Pseudomonas syringae pv. actinidiae]
MTNKDMADGRFFEQGIVDMQKGTTRVPIDVLNAFVTQKADDHFSAR